MSFVPDYSRYYEIPEHLLPREWFPFYVVYKYEWSKSTYILGYHSDEKADEVMRGFLSSPGIIRCEVFGHFPIELLKSSK